ncbi:MAG: hypothetical protein ACREE6_17960, partial [Limisphaerales bacterium]
MKNKKNAGQKKSLSPESQKRLAAYTTAAGLGALFSGPGAHGQVVESTALGPYPATLAASSGTNTMVFPIDVDGDGSNDFQIVIFPQQTVFANHSQVVDAEGLPPVTGTTNQFLNDTASSYLHAWLGGESIS